jgi:hypothetical protein
VIKWQSCSLAYGYYTVHNINVNVTHTRALRIKNKLLNVEVNLSS